MQALYTGRVVRDGTGCLRLAAPDGHAVVWPVGYRLAGEPGSLRVRDAGGQVVGRIGDGFRLAGGEVASLHEELPVSDATRREAETRCPGRYWLVSEAPTG